QTANRTAPTGQPLQLQGGCAGMHFGTPVCGRTLFVAKKPGAMSENADPVRFLTGKARTQRAV
ncbi:MAG: hypothetical protein AAFN16_27105, partial [Pseudomonadota bacterium]